MYKVNESLAGVSYEAGRALAFTPGWLENESVWLHMEYKYLLALLKNRLYDSFSKAFRDAAIPFLDPAQYGRSPLENVSFIASSANPDESIHGQGFVARLSGSTAEFLHIWQILFFGDSPFRQEKDQLQLRFTPFIPEYLMPADGIPEAVFLGSIPVQYHTGGAACLIPDQYSIQAFELTYRDGKKARLTGNCLTGEYAHAVRDGFVSRISVFME